MPTIYHLLIHISAMMPTKVIDPLNNS